MSSYLKRGKGINICEAFLTSFARTFRNTVLRLEFNKIKKKLSNRFCIFVMFS